MEQPQGVNSHVGCSPQAPTFQGRCTRQSAQHPRGASSAAGVRPQLVPAHSGACPDFQALRPKQQDLKYVFLEGHPSKAREIAGLLGEEDTHRTQLLTPRGSRGALPQPAQARPEAAPSRPRRPLWSKIEQGYSSTSIANLKVI